MTITRLLALGLAALTVGLASSQLWAQQQAVRLVVGFPPGGSADILARLMAERMQRSLAQLVIVENRPGAGGIVAAQFVKNAAPNGSVLLLSSSGAITSYPHTHANLGYDPFRDFAPVAHLVNLPLAMVVSTNTPATTLAEFVALARKDQKYANFGSPVAGGLAHWVGVQLSLLGDLELLHVPYKGSAPLALAVATGEIAAAVSSVPDLANLARAGKARLIAVSGERRSDHFQNVPTFKEQGFEVDFSAWYALYAPAGTSATTIERLSQAAIAAIRSPELVGKLDGLGFEATGRGPAELGAFGKSEFEKLRPIVRASKFKAD